MPLSPAPSPLGRAEKVVTPSPVRHQKSCGDLLGSGKSQKSIRDYFSQSPSVNSNSNSSSKGNSVGSSSSNRIKRKRRVKVKEENRLQMLNVLTSEDSDDDLKLPSGYASFLSGVPEASSTVCGITKRRLFDSNEFLSQTKVIVISSSEESDFELHSSKRSCNASSQLLHSELNDESRCKRNSSGLNYQADSQLSEETTKPDALSARMKAPHKVALSGSGHSPISDSVTSGETRTGEFKPEKVELPMMQNVPPNEATCSTNELLDPLDRQARDPLGLMMHTKNLCDSSRNDPKTRIKLTLVKDSSGSWRTDPGKTTGVCLSGTTTTRSGLGPLNNDADIIVLSSEEDTPRADHISLSDDSAVSSPKFGASSNSSDSLPEVRDLSEGRFDLMDSKSPGPNPDALQVGNIVKACNNDSQSPLAHSGDSGNLSQCVSDSLDPSLSDDNEGNCSTEAVPSSYIGKIVIPLQVRRLDFEKFLSTQLEGEDKSSVSGIVNVKNLRNVEQSSQTLNDLLPSNIVRCTQAENTTPSADLLNISHISDSDGSVCESDLDILPPTLQESFTIQDDPKSPGPSDSDSSMKNNSTGLLDASADFFSEVINSFRESSFQSENSIIGDSIKSKGTVEPEQIQVYSSSGEDASDTESSTVNGSLTGLESTHDVLDADGCRAESPKCDAVPVSLYSEKSSRLSPAGQDESMRITCEPQHVLGSPERIDDLHLPSTSQRMSTTSNDKALLLDVLLAEARNFAAPIFQREPLCTFSAQYSTLTSEERYILHGYLLKSIENRDLTFHRSDALPFSELDRLVSIHILEYVSTDDSLKIFDLLSISEMTKVLNSLAQAVPESEEDMKSLLIQLNSKDSNKISLAIRAVAYKKFFRLTVKALSSIHICLKLASMCLNLSDKLYKSRDVVRHLNKLIGDLRVGTPLLPINITPLSKLFASEYEIVEFLELCSMKTNTLVKGVPLINKICASLVVGSISVNDSPTLQFIFSNYVYALDEELKKVAVGSDDETDLHVSYCLGVLLNQNIAGHCLKTEWCRRKLKCLNRLMPLNTLEELKTILSEEVCPLEFILRSEFVSKLLENKKLKLSVNQESELRRLLKQSNHHVNNVPEFGIAIKVANTYPVVGRKTNGRILNLRRACVFENYSVAYPNGLQDSGALLFNTVYLVFWDAIYSRVDGAFVSKFQKCPLDWGSGGFFEKRRSFIENRVKDMKESGYAAIVALMDHLKSKFSSTRCVADWPVISSYFPQMTHVLEVLGLNRFFSLAIYFLQNHNERIHGFPDFIVWNDVSVKFIGTRKPTDLLYPHQVVWLEKLTEIGVEAEECKFQL